MIYLLEFSGKLYEFKKSWGRSSQMLYSITQNFPDMMILHRYELCFFFPKKFQTNSPDKIELFRLDGKSAILYHLDLYSGCSEKIVPLIEHCIKNDIDLFVPISDGIIGSLYIDDAVKNPHRYEVREILEGYEHVVYDFRNTPSDGDLELKRKEMIRDLKLRKLFD